MIPLTTDSDHYIYAPAKEIADFRYLRHRGRCLDRKGNRSSTHPHSHHHLTIAAPPGIRSQMPPSPHRPASDPRCHHRLIALHQIPDANHLHASGHRCPTSGMPALEQLAYTSIRLGTRPIPSNSEPAPMAPRLCDDAMLTSHPHRPCSAYIAISQLHILFYCHPFLLPAARWPFHLPFNL